MTTETLEISVTQDDIQQGKRYHSLACPIALAAQRAVGSNALMVFVTPAMLILRDEAGDNHYPLPLMARQFQTRFDRATWDDTDTDVEPFSFTVHRHSGFPSKGNPFPPNGDFLLP
jgi:hypothetical protein